MVGMTDEGRRRQIEQALAARQEKPATDKHTHPLPWRGKETYFPVIELPLDVPLLNAESHRVRADLEAPDYDFVCKERSSDPAQNALTLLWRQAHRKFDKLKESLGVEGQIEPGVMTRAGVLINGNTRLVALRDLQDPNRLWMRVAVLNSDATDAELRQLEFKLQIRDPLLDPYKLSAELLSIEDMARKDGMSAEQIAFTLGWYPAKPSEGKKQVDFYRRIFQMIREMQRRNPKLPITFFDEPYPSKLEQLKALEQKYSAFAVDDPEGAGQLLETWMVFARSGFSSVHQIRPVINNPNFVPDYLLPRLEQQDPIGPYVGKLLFRGKPVNSDLPGLDDLGTETHGDNTSAYDVRPLRRIVEKADSENVTLPGAPGPVEAVDVKLAIRSAIDGAISDQKIDDKAEDTINAPVEALRKASQEIVKATKAYADLRDTKEFERSRSAFEYQLKQVRKRFKALEELTGAQEKQRANH